MNARAVAVVLSLLLVCATEAAEKHRVAVTFDIAAGHPYRKVFTTPESIAAIHDAVLKTIVETLSEKIGFVEFTTGSAPNRLSFTLEDKNAEHASGLREVGFRVRFTPASGSPTLDDVFWPFRGAGHATDPIAPRESFIQGLQIVIRNGQINDIVGRELKVLVIAREALPLTKEAAFVMPFKNTTLSIGRGTQFEVHTNVIKPSMTIEYDYQAEARGVSNECYDEPYKNSLVALITGKKDEFQMFEPAAVQTTGVSVSLYVKLPPKE